MSDQHFMICGHGKLNYGYLNQVDWDFNKETTPISLANNVRLVVYIPPGVVFSANTGLKIQKFVDGREMLIAKSSASLDEILLQKLRKNAKTKPKEFAGERWFFKYTYGKEDDVLDKYPLVVAGDDHTIYDYTITGPKNEQQKADFGDFQWGVISFDEGSPKKLEEEYAAGFDAGYLSAIIEKYATNEDAMYYFHLIFCRVEILDQTGIDKVHPSLQTKVLNFIWYGQFPVIDKNLLLPK